MRRDDSQHADHLGEDENSVTVLLKPREELVEEDHLSRVHDDTLQGLLFRVGPRLGAFKQVRVIRGLLQLHRNVEERNVVVGTTERGVVLP